jgi:hypothetical protein
VRFAVRNTREKREKRETSQREKREIYRVKPYISRSLTRLTCNGSD